LGVRTLTRRSSEEKEEGRRRRLLIKYVDSEDTSEISMLIVELPI
jgi:hypothetical protein